MLAQFEPNAFILTIDADRARRFYCDVLGLEFLSDDPFAIVLRSKGVEIRVVRIESFSPSPHTIFGWMVPDIEAVVRELSAAGIVFERYPFLEQDAAGIWSDPTGRAKVAWFKDPDGNLLSVSQH